MSVLRLSSVVMPAAALGPENPLPPLRRLPDPRGGLDVSEADAEMMANLGYGHVESLLPYTFQDGYGRETPDRELTTAVLENDVLRAEFLLGYGGRLMSLRHRARNGEERELLHFPPKLQLANLGLRNAWFAGGVEWNLGTFGHTALTCSPLHAVRVTREDGTPVLRMYEYERQHRLVYQLDCYLPDGSPALLVHVRIRNPFPQDAPVYWWSSAAVPQTPDSRALLPASSAYHFSYTGKMRRIPFPQWRGSDAADCSYPGRVDHGADYFAEIPGGERRWIAAVDGAGRGLFQASTERMRGRKLFHWGTGSGGRNWQDWLSGPGRAYFEIQAGLARTQLEHLRLPGRRSWSWVEAYGLLEVAPEKAHSAKWSEASKAAGDALEALLPAHRLDDELATMTALADKPPEEVLHSGSGWGALERRALGRNRALTLPGTPFPDATIGRDQQSWLSLVRKGRMPTPAPALPPSSYAVGPVWRELLERATSDPDAATWFTWLHLGVNRYHAGDLAGARQAWDRSLARAETAWAHRNLAVLDEAEGRLNAAADRCLRAHQLSLRLRPLTIETLRLLIAAERPGEALAVVDRLTEPDRFTGRVLMLECRAALDAGDLVRARRILETGLVVDDIREGEDPLSDLWWEFHARQAGGLGPLASQHVREEHPLPCSYDYSVRQL